jgi:signal transduction histidine kinase
MRQRTTSRIAWSLGAVAVAAVLAGALIQLLTPQEQLPPGLRSPTTEILDSLTNLGLPIIGALIASRRPRNPLGWILILAGLGLGVSTFGGAYAAYSLLIEPGSLPAPYAFAWVSNWSWTLGVGLLPFLLLLFPTGALHSRRWRPVFWGAGLFGAGMFLTALIGSALNWSRPFLEVATFDPLLEGMLIGAVYGTLGFSVLGVVSQFFRLRQAQGEERQQLKWFVTAMAMFVAALVVTSLEENAALLPLLSVTTLFLYASIAIAILKYRLYDIDVVINKTLVFGALAAFFTVVYIALVVGIGTLIGSRSSTVLTIAAAVLIAVAFNPVRERARHLANRLVYGKRATPYEVLAEFGERVAAAYASEDVLGRMAAILGEGTGATRARVWLRVGAELRPAAAWPNGEADEQRPLRLAEDALPTFEDPTTAVPVRHQGELLGALSITKSQAEPVTPTEEKLVADLAGQAGLLLRNVRLIEELRASRQRLVAAQDEERRRLERNIHDGAQQQLVALQIKLGLVETILQRDPEKALSMVGDIKRGANETLEDLRDLARGIYPPLLADQGLVAALQSQARRAAVPVVIEGQGLRRYTPAIEAAVYFCTLEALQNVAKYAAAARVTVRLAASDGELRFEVIDDGRGFDPSTTGHGTGLQGMADRLEALGGSLAVRSSPGSGTTLEGVLPVARRPGASGVEAAE